MYAMTAGSCCGWAMPKMKRYRWAIFSSSWISSSTHSSSKKSSKTSLSSFFRRTSTSTMKRMESCSKNCDRNTSTRPCRSFSIRLNFWFHFLPSIKNYICLRSLTSCLASWTQDFGNSLRAKPVDQPARSTGWKQRPSPAKEWRIPPPDSRSSTNMPNT